MKETPFIEFTTFFIHYQLTSHVRKDLGNLVHIVKTTFQKRKD